MAGFPIMFPALPINCRCIADNLAGGPVARGCLGASMDAMTVVVLEDDVYGGQVWVRPRNFVKLGDYFTFTYRDMTNQEQTGIATIPPATHRGAMIQVVLQSPSDRAKKILGVDQPSGGNSHDILSAWARYNAPLQLARAHQCQYQCRNSLTNTLEADLIENIKASLRRYLGAFKIGESLQYSDVMRFFQAYYDETADENVGMALVGIDEIVQLTALGVGAVSLPNWG